MRVVLVERYSRLSRAEELLHKLLGGVALSYGCGSAADRTKHMDIVNFGRGCEQRGCKSLRFKQTEFTTELSFEPLTEVR